MMQALSWTHNLAVIANPRAGKGKASRFADRLQRWLKGAGVSAPLAFTDAAGHARALAAELLEHGHTGFVAIGGDGTIHEVANALASAGKGTLAALPCGNGNDLARALAIPRRWEAWVAMLRGGQVRSMDLGRVAGRYFTTVAAIGFDAEVAERINALPGRVGGKVQYLLMALRHLFAYQPKRLRLTGDFGVVEGEMFLTAVGNGAYYGGGMKITPGADPFDGMLNVCFVEPISRARTLMLIPSVFSGGHARYANVRLSQSQSIHVESLDQPMWIYADGERIVQTPATIETAAKAIQVLLPAGG